MRKESSDGDVVNLAPLPRGDVRGEISQVAGVRFDRMRRDIALAQGTQELVDGLSYDGSLISHSQHRSPPRPGERKTQLLSHGFTRINTDKPFLLLFYPCESVQIRGQVLFVPPCLLAE